MATRLEMLRKSAPVFKNFMDSVFLKNRAEDWSGDDVMTYAYRKSDLVYIVISTTMRAIGQIPIRVGRTSGEEEVRYLPLRDPWQQKFDRPNYLMDRYSFVEAIIGHLMLDGDVFIVPFPPGNPEFSSLWVVKKRFMGPIKDPNTGQLAGWNYNVKGVMYDSFGGTILTENSIPLKVEEVCHIYFWNPYDPIMGLAPSEAGKLNIVADYKASRYTGNFFDDGAQPGGVLHTDRALSDKQFNRILQQFETKHQGYIKSHRVTLLENGLQYTQAGLSQKDMEFVKLRELSARRIYQIYGMKEAIISETKTVNRATAQEERAEWWDSTNLPMMRMVTSALNFTLFEGTDLRCVFDITQIEALRQALSDKVNTGYKLWQMGATFNQVNDRLGLGFKKNKWGNTWYMPTNLMPVEDYVAPPGPSSAPPIEIPPPKEGVMIDALNVDSFVRMIPDKVGVKKDDEDKKGEEIWNRMNSRLAPVEEACTKKVSRAFYDMRKKTLDLLYNGKSLKDEGAVEAYWYPEESKQLAKSMDNHYKEALLLGVALLCLEIGIEISVALTDPEVLRFLVNKSLKVRGVVQTIKVQILRELTNGYKAGETIDQIADRIRGVFDIAKSRTKVIARTEMMSSLNEGRFLAINRSGIKNKMWYTALDERVRDQHRPMHGKTIKVGEIWVMPDGTMLRHPGDMNAPPHQVVNCRCIEVIFS